VFGGLFGFSGHWTFLYRWRRELDFWGRMHGRCVAAPPRRRGHTHVPPVGREFGQG
jgi:hypothetical protein